MQANAAYQIRKTSKKLIVTLDREMVDEERVLDWLNFLKLEYLVKKASFGPEIEEIGKNRPRLGGKKTNRDSSRLMNYEPRRPRFQYFVRLFAHSQF
jgi:hypothetical protein